MDQSRLELKRAAEKLRDLTGKHGKRSFMDEMKDLFDETAKDAGLGGFGDDFFEDILGKKK